MNGRSESTNLFVTVQTLVMRIMGKEDRSWTVVCARQALYTLSCSRAEVNL